MNLPYSRFDQNDPEVNAIRKGMGLINDDDE